MSSVAAGSAPLHPLLQAALAPFEGVWTTDERAAFLEALQEAFENDPCLHTLLQRADGEAVETSAELGRSPLLAPVTLPVAPKKVGGGE